MKQFSVVSYVLIGILFFSGCALQKSSQQAVETLPPVGTPQSSRDTTPNSTTSVQAVMKTSMGDVTIELYPADAPKTVDNFLTLARKGYYNGTKFHRVIQDFMIQGGDPLSKDASQKARWGTGGPGYAFADEINALKLVKGALAMANAGPNTNGSQFFIVTAEATPWLDGKHTNFGSVVSGMDVVEAIARVDRDENDRPLTDVVIQEIIFEP